MSNLLQWLQAKLTKPMAEPDYDLAKDRWDPVPASASGVDWGAWLEEPRSIRMRAKQQAAVPQFFSQAHREGSAPGQEVDAKDAARPRMLTLPPADKKWRDVLKSYGDQLTEEELKIIRGQLER
jgi:hypothetical protein